MRLIVFGAAGGIGHHVTEQALAAGHHVTAFVRRPDAVHKHEHLRVAKGDVTDAASVSRELRDVDAVISAIGNNDRKSKLRSEGMTNILAAMKQNGVKRLACISAQGVGDSRAQVTRASFVFGRIILPLFLAEPYADMDKMEGLVRQSGLEWTIVRPAQLTNGPGTGKPRAVPLDQTAGPKIPRADVATFLIEAATEGKYLGQSVSICAP